MPVSNKWLELQNSDCPDCSTAINQCQCPSNSGIYEPNAKKSMEAVTNSPIVKADNTDEKSLVPKPVDLFSLTFTPTSKKNEEDKENSAQNGHKYQALVPLDKILEAFENFLTQIAKEQGITVAELKQQGYGSEMQGNNTLVLYFGNKDKADIFTNMMLNNGMAKKLEPEAPQKQADMGEPEYSSPSPFGKAGKAPELTPYR